MGGVWSNFEITQSFDNTTTFLINEFGRCVYVFGGVALGVEANLVPNALHAYDLDRGFLD